MGRPKGSLNKKHKKYKIPKKHYKKRGRPKGSKNKKSSTESPVQAIVSDIKKTKFIGYCSKCNFIITKKDLVSTYIFSCPSCGKRARVKTLKSAIKNTNRPSSKKEYLESVINADHLDSLPSTGGDDLDPDSLKVVTE